MNERVVIGIPIAPDRMAHVETICIAESWTYGTLNKTVCVPSPSPEEGRDKIVEIAKYMIPRPSHLLFIDSDVVPRKNTLKAMLEHDRDIISAVVPICQKGVLQWNVRRNGKFLQELPTNPFKPDSVGFGCVLVKMDVIDKLEWPYWRSEYKPGLRTVGEDIYFCEKAKKSGFDIWCDPKIKCDHVTRASYLSIMRNMKGK